MCFYGILEGKNVFLVHKKKEVKKVEKLTFPKVLVQCFGQKMVILPHFFFGNIVQENVFYDVLEKKRFSSLQKKKFKTSKY